ncbi:hypothetical protein BOTBODRAFT_345071 [Botryobasidium botryosum FD-172 SS1]|uniref:Uncharacterized protein n=1 Tax=Botryobasidium botryosum (strain FD-172 SS1) TaxID=930990 RepID=A0A067MSI0_BOTB1|nr:hypothetical protein BOTBODRAFT_345071 [Botryobasidium botryosum FD-172 SS1]
MRISLSATELGGACGEETLCIGPPSGTSDSDGWPAQAARGPSTKRSTDTVAFLNFCSLSLGQFPLAPYTLQIQLHAALKTTELAVMDTPIRARFFHLGFLRVRCLIGYSNIVTPSPCPVFAPRLEISNRKQSRSILYRPRLDTKKLGVRPTFPYPSGRCAGNPKGWVALVNFQLRST